MDILDVFVDDCRVVNGVRSPDAIAEHLFHLSQQLASLLLYLLDDLAGVRLQ